jgi:hypothetical protein
VPRVPGDGSSLLGRDRWGSRRSAAYNRFVNTGQACTGVKPRTRSAGRPDLRIGRERQSHLPTWRQLQQASGSIRDWRDLL